MMRKLLFALALLLGASAAHAQTWTQVQWGIDKTATPYTLGVNLSGTWRPFGTVDPETGTFSGLFSGVAIPDASLTYAKMQAVAASRLLGNPNASSGSMTEIPLGSTLVFSSGALQTGAGTGDVSWGAGSFATTIGANAVTNAKSAQMAAHTYKGNNTADTANAADVAVADVVADLGLKSAIEYVIDGGGSTINTGHKGFIEIPYTCTISRWTLLADVAGTITVDVLKSSYANFPTTTTITASAKPSMTSAQKGQSTVLTGWTTTLNAGDILDFNVTSATTITRVTISLLCTRTAQ